MPPRPAALGGLLVMLTAGLAPAGPLPAGWSYRNPLASFAIAADGTGGITFPNTAFQTALGDGEIVASQVASYSIASAAGPDRVSGLPYRFALEVRDDASGEATTLSFAGTLTGDLWRTGTALGNQFTGRLVQTADLGGSRYTVALDAFTAPTGYGDAAAGAVTARVSVGGIPAVSTPEPATGLLALAGLPLLAACRRR